MKPLFYTLLIIASLAAEARSNREAVEDTRTFEKTFEVNGDAQVNINVHESEVKIGTWDQNKVQVKAVIAVEARSREDLENMFEILKVNMTGSPEQVDIIASNCIRKKTSVIETKTKIKVRADGISANVVSYSVHYEIQMPRSNNLNIKNRYGTVELGEHRAALDAELYECNVRATAVQAREALITLKYSNAFLGTMEQGQLQLYESSLEMASVESLKLNTKYSSITLGTAKSIVLSAYEDDLDIGNIDQIKGQHRYGSMDIGNAKMVDLELYEVNMKLSNADVLVLNNCRYSRIESAALHQVTMMDSYETDVQFGNVDAMNTSGKYSSYRLLKLKESVKLSGYECNLRIEMVGPGFKTIEVSGKYMNTDINMDPSAMYALEANTHYGSISYPRSKFDIRIDREVEDRTEVVAQSKGYTGDSKVSVQGYEVNADLR